MKATKSFKWSPNGRTILSFQAGDELIGAVEAWAIRHGYAQKRGRPAGSKNAPKPENKMEPAPENKGSDEPA